MILPDYWLFESVKLTAQLIGALLVAWLAVRWALRRYKREKAWEKQLQAYVDIILAMGDMRSTLASWLRAEEEGFTYTQSHDAEMGRRYRAAYVRLEEQNAIAQLLLPEETAESIQGMFKRLADVPEDWAPHDRYDEQIAIVIHTTKDIVQQGQGKLGKF